MLVCLLQNNLLFALNFLASSLCLRLGPTCYVGKHLWQFFMYSTYIILISGFVLSNLPTHSLHDSSWLSVSRFWCLYGVDFILRSVVVQSLILNLKSTKYTPPNTHFLITYFNFSHWSTDKKEGATSVTSSLHIATVLYNCHLIIFTFTLWYSKCSEDGPAFLDLQFDADMTVVQSCGFFFHIYLHVL